MGPNTKVMPPGVNSMLRASSDPTRLRISQHDLVSDKFTPS